MIQERSYRVLNVIRSVDPRSGGTVEGLRQTALAMSALGHRDEVVCLDDPGSPWLADFPLPVRALGPAHTAWGWSPRLVPWIRAHAGEFDAVVVHGIWQYTGIATLRALRGSRTPYFVWFHGMMDPWFKREYPFKHLKKWLFWPWSDYRVARDARAVLFTATEEARLASRSFWLYSVRPRVIGYGLSDDPPSPPDARARFLQDFPALRGKRLVLFIARLHPKKGGELLVEAFARVAGQDPSLHLVMAGPDPNGHGRAWQARAAALGVAERITWTGLLQGDRKWGAFQAAEVFVLPSHQENFGVAVVEALAMRVPVLITTQVNIHREIVDAGAGLAEADTVDGTVTLLRRWLAMRAEARENMRDRAYRC